MRFCLRYFNLDVPITHRLLLDMDFGVVSISISISICTYIFFYFFVYVNVYAHVYVNANVYVNVFVCIYLHTFTHVDRFKKKHIYISNFEYTRRCIYSSYLAPEIHKPPTGHRRLWHFRHAVGGNVREAQDCTRKNATWVSFRWVLLMDTQNFGI